MTETNTLRNEELDEITVMILAPGANRNNTTVKVDNGSSDKNSSMLYITVEEPELPEGLKDKAELSLRTTHCLDSKYDTKTLRVGIRDGIIFINAKTSKDRVQEVKIDEN